MIAVSYTHLLSEVPNEAVEFDWSYYKIVLPVPNHEMEYNENMVQNPEYELPVSYTHLDVYKRQLYVGTQ